MTNTYSVTKWCLYALSAFFVVALLGLLLIRPQLYAVEVARVLEGQLSNDTTRVSFSEPTLTYRSFGARHIRILWPRIMTWLDVDAAIGSLPLSCIVMLNPCLHFNAELYGGKVHAAVKQLSDLPVVSAEISGSEISNHPLPGSLGIEGIVDLTLNELQINESELTGTVILVLKDWSKALSSRYNLRAIGFPVEVEIPAFDSLNARVNLECKPEICTFHHASINSSLGEFNLSGNIKDVPGNALFALTVHVRLTAAGQQSIGQWLPLISQGTLQQEDGSFKMHLEGSSGRLRSTFARLN